MNNDPDLEMILADMRREFIETAEDRLDEVEQSVANLLGDARNVDNEILEIKRHIHSVKGLGGSFGFSSVTLWAHALEDYLETTRDLGVDQLWDIQAFVDRMREIIESGSNPDDETTASAIRKLRLRGRKRDMTGLKAGTSILLLMPKGIQRKIIGRELITFGFDIVIAETSMQAIEFAVTHRPDIVISSQEIDRISGLELAGILNAIHATAHHKFLLMTAAEDVDRLAAQIPDNVRIIRKGVNFARDLIKFLGDEAFLAA